MKLSEGKIPEGDYFAVVNSPDGYVIVTALQDGTITLNSKVIAEIPNGDEFLGRACELVERANRKEKP